VTTTRDSIVDAERWLAGVPVEGSSALCVIGLGQGCLLDALDQRGWSGRVVALEPDTSSSPEGLGRPQVQAWLNAGRLTIVAGPTYDGLDRALLSIELTSEKPVIVLNPSVARAHRDQAMQAARLIGRAWFGARANQEAKRQNGGRYLLNTLRNARTIAAEGDAAALAGIGAHVPAIVVGAGPSLDRNLPDIAAYRDRALIIAADTSLRPLLAAGIHPDLVVALDPTETNARHLTELPPCPGTFLVAEGSLDPEALPHFAGRTFFFNVSDHHPWPWLRSLGVSRGRLRAWGSVLTTAFDLALTMDCDPIVFAGADLAFTDGRPYARGTTFEEVWYRAQAWGQPLEECWSAAVAAWPETFETDVRGASVRTAPHLRAFRDWIATEAGRAVGRTIFNGTGAGILLGPGIVQASLELTLSHLPALATAARDRIAGTCRPNRQAVCPFPAEIDTPTLNAWRGFGGTDCNVEAVMRALGRCGGPGPPVDLPPAVRPAANPTTDSAEVVLECTAADRDLVSTIEDAWRRLGDVDRLVLLDQTGAPGGASVRRALFRFLERHPDVTARHGRFFDPFSKTSWVDRRSPGELFPGLDLDKFAPHHEAVAMRLAPLLVEHFTPGSVLDIGCGAGYWLRALESHGVADVCGVEGEDLATFAPTRSFDLCLCLGVVQRLHAQAADAVVAACTKASDTVAFSVAAAAIGAPGYINERPSSVWHELFLEHGFAAHDELRPIVEERWGGYRSSYDLLTVYRRVASGGNQLSAPTRSALIAAARRADDLVLQTHWYAHALGAVPRATGKPAMPQVRYERLTIPPARMESGGAKGVRVFRFRAAAALSLLAPGAEPPSLHEDQRPLRRLESAEQDRSGLFGTFAVHQDSIAFSAADGSDPRHNGRHYTVSVPAHIAWLERLPIATILEHGL
jgi:SAM-dependent methyltransferase